MTPLRETAPFEVLALEEERDDDARVTVTLRCDSQALSRLLAPDEQRGFGRDQARAGRRVDRRRFREFWRRAEPGRRQGLLAAAVYLDRCGMPQFCRSDIEQLIAGLSEDERPQMTQRSLIHLAHRGVLERRRRAVYALSQLGRSTFETHERERSDRRRRAGRKASSRRQARPLRRLPCLDGVSLFLRQLNSSTIAHKVLVCAYFLRRYCQRQEFDRELVAACFRRSRGQQVPSSLSTVLSQVLSRRLGVIVPVDQRGFYRLTEAEYEGLQRKAYVLAAERKLLRSRPELDVAALDPSNRQGRGSS